MFLASWPQEHLQGSFALGMSQAGKGIIQAVLGGNQRAYINQFSCK
jgi:hypothetical protein